MAKNIVVCCDGTGNQISENISNVLKLYRVLGKTDDNQVAFYDPGVGTLARPNPWIKFRQDVTAVLGLATGYGLNDKVLAAYEFLIDHYQEGDRIFLFGFSRGAHAVRVLAGFLHKVGLLSSQQKNLAGAALTAYIQTSADIENNDASGRQARTDQAWQFARIVSSRWVTIKFIGVWDTVASVIVPRPDRFYTFSLQSLPFTRQNPSVEVFRQAIAIDERRSMFRLSKWRESQMFQPNRFDKTKTSQHSQDIKQVWFAGVHSDVGGGYPEKDSGISKFPLLWMIDEAKKHGLLVTTATVNQLARGHQRKDSPFAYEPPCITCEPHNSMTAGWRLLEWVPKPDRFKEWTRPSAFGYYVPKAEPRRIPDNALIHQSVFDKIASMPTYRPENIPARYQAVPYDEGSTPEIHSQPGTLSRAIRSS
jgi:uncharacterized protein (DUF2235 family)